MMFLSGMGVDYLLIANLLHFAFSIFMLVFMRFQIENNNNSLSRHEFKRFMVIALVCLFADMLSYVFDKRQFFGAFFMNHLSMLVSVLFTALIGYWWNRFFDVLFHIKDTGKVKKLFYLAPSIIAAVLLVINFFTGILFSMGEHNVYTRGPLYALSFIVQYFSFAVIIVRAFLLKFSNRTIRREKMRSSVIWLSIITIFFGLLQAITAGQIAIHCLGIVAGIFIIFCRFQDDQITNDFLTGLSNRNALESYLVDRIKDYHDGQHGTRILYLILLDINNFKRINDIYGHVEGDKALKCLAQALKRIGGKHRQTLFISRFGGDEFALIYETSSKANVESLCKEIKDTIKAETEGWKYWITVSAGYTEYTGRDMSMDRFFTLADNALYTDKRRMEGHITGGT